MNPDPLPAPDPSARALLAAAGLLSWGIAGWSTLIGQPTAVWSAAYITFAIAFIVSTALPATTDRIRLAGLAVQTLAALVIVHYGEGHLGALLLTVVAGEAPFFMRMSWASAWIGVQSIGLVADFSVKWGTPDGVVTALIYVALQLFTLGAAYSVRREAIARSELAVANTELAAAQARAAEIHRTAERLRIARELHDSVGHHLTALSLNLELAAHAPAEQSTQAVTKAREMTRTLLAEVRAVVGATRAEDPFDLRQALHSLAAGVLAPKLHLSIPAHLEMPEPLTAHALFRCVQEAVTNAMRHAHADNLWVELVQKPNEISVTARDDGHGCSHLKLGNGLVGLKERLAEIGGRLELDSAAGAGLVLRAHVPVNLTS